MVYPHLTVYRTSFMCIDGSIVGMRRIMSSEAAEPLNLGNEEP